MLPCESQATSVGWRNRPSTGGRGGVTCSHGLVFSSADSLRRPNTHTPRPGVVHLATMTEPFSVPQVVVSLSALHPSGEAQRSGALPPPRPNSPVAAGSRSLASLGGKV